MTRRESAPKPSGSRGVNLYVFAIATLAVFGVAGSWLFAGPPTDAIALVTLLILGVISVGVQERDVGSKIALSFLSIVVIASIVLAGPVGSALIGAFAVVWERGNRPFVARVFNSSMLACQGVAGGLVYLLIGGANDLAQIDGPAELLLKVGLPLMAADVVQMLVNAILLAGIVRLSSGVPLRRFFVQIVSTSGPAYIGYGVIGFLFVILWGPADVGPFSALLILAPLYVARWAFVQFGDEQRAHERTLSALVTAVETKDPYAAGHSARIAQLAEWMSEPLSMGAQDAESLRFAAMLHDVGKVGVPTRLLRRPTSLTPADLAILTRHPEFGVRLVGDIDFLTGSLAGIRHHHERWDGLGYPDGLAGDDIPLASRIIAVADAFDALTTDRYERPALDAPGALRELERRRGRQFDPAVVAALATALERHEWTPTTSDEDRLVAMRGYLDHDDPVTWERVAGPSLPPSPTHTEPVVDPASGTHTDRVVDPEQEVGLEQPAREQVPSP